MSYSPRFDDAVTLAVDAFRGVRRKGTTIPYVTHLMAVAALVGEGGGDEDQLIAAILHDYLEDIPGATAEALAERFGARVARLVVALSDSVTHPKPPWQERKSAYLAHLRHEPAEVKLISAADKLHNAQTLLRDVRADGPATLARFSGGHAGTLWYYAALPTALRDGWNHWLLGELDATVGALHVAAGEGPGVAARILG